MFDIGFSEMLVIAVVALIVIGPERLPKVARTAGHLFGRLQRYVNDVKADINREMELDELRKLRTQVQEAAQSIEQSVTQASRDFEASARGVEQDLVAAGLASSSAAAPEPVAALPEFAEPPGEPGSPVTEHVDAATDRPSAASPATGAPGSPATDAQGSPAADAQGSPAGSGAAPPRQAALPGFEQG